MHKPPQAANELSPWRALLLQMARPCLQTGAAGTTVCTLVGIANYFQVGEEMGRKRTLPLHAGRRGAVGWADGTSECHFWSHLSPQCSQASADTAPLGWRGADGASEQGASHNHGRLSPHLVPDALPVTWQAPPEPKV